MRRFRSADLPFVSLPDGQGMIGLFQPIRDQHLLGLGSAAANHDMLVSLNLLIN